MSGDEGEVICDDEYEVEAIQGRRRVGGRVQYLIKWAGYSESENTWQYEEDCMCPDLLIAYNEAHPEPPPSARKRQSRKRRLSKAEKVVPKTVDIDTDDVMEDGNEVPAKTENDVMAVKTEEESAEVTDDLDEEYVPSERKLKEEPKTKRPKLGYEFGNKVREIIGACPDRENRIHFCIQWEDHISGPYTFVASEIVREKDPQKVIDFYETRVVFTEKTLK